MANIANLIANRQYFQLRCNDAVNYDQMRELLTVLCHDDFSVDCVVPTRTKGIYQSKCTWHICYKVVNGDINGKKAFRAGVEKLISNQPFGSKVVASGRYGKDYGIHIQLGTVNCACPLDFDYATTLVHNLRNQRLEETTKLGSSAFDNHIGYSTSGLMSNARTLVDHVKSESHWLIFNETMNVQSCAEAVLGVVNHFTNILDSQITHKIGLFMFEVNDIDNEEDIGNGLMADARVKCQSHWFGKMTVASCAQAVSSLAIQFGDSADGESPMTRPFNVAIVFAGIDYDDPQLWHVDSSRSGSE